MAYYGRNSISHCSSSIVHRASVLLILEWTRFHHGIEFAPILIVSRPNKWSQKTTAFNGFLKNDKIVNKIMNLIKVKRRWRCREWRRKKMVPFVIIYHCVRCAIVENNLIIFVHNIRWECSQLDKKDMCHQISGCGMDAVWWGQWGRLSISMPIIFRKKEENNAIAVNCAWKNWYESKSMQTLTIRKLCTFKIYR